MATTTPQPSPTSAPVAPSALIRAFGHEEADVKTLEATVWRAVEIYPGRDDDPVVLQQHLKFGAEHINYDVVSCNPSSGGPTAEVRTPDGRAIRLDAALVRMMQHLRLPSKSRTIWNSALW